MEELNTTESVVQNVHGNSAKLMAEEPEGKIHNHENMTASSTTSDTVNGLSNSSRPLGIAQESSLLAANKSRDVKVETPSRTLRTDSEEEKIKKKRRRVRFPEESVVANTCDPPTPWGKPFICDSEQLIKAYLQSCEIQMVKPMQSLLNQLQVINNFADRNETLTLKGERLDARVCETIEEVLRRVQFRMIDLEATHLDDQGAMALFDMIEFYESCTKLNLAFNKNICARGWQSCSSMLRKTSCLEYLDLRVCGLNNQTMLILGRALRLGCALTTLHLENTTISGRPLANLMSALEINQVLRELFLADNKLMPTDGIQLGHMLKVNHTLKLLDVRNNHLQDVGTDLLCKGLYNQGRGLVTLVLWNNQITYQSMDSMAGALFSSETLETINLGHNSITNEGIHRLKEGLLQNKSLLRIGLQASKLTCEGAVALAEYIADSTRLVRIDLRENEIKTGGLMALSLSLKVNESLTRIDLDKQPKRESGIKDYIDQQTRLHTDIMNGLLRNRELLRKREEERAQQETLERQDTVESVEEVKADIEPEIVTPSMEADDSNEHIVFTREESKDAEVDDDVKDHLNLPLQSSRTQCLESPAFIPESAMPFVAPPTKLELETVKDRQIKTLASELELPLSPLCSHGVSLRSQADSIKLDVAEHINQELSSLATNEPCEDEEPRSSVSANNSSHNSDTALTTDSVIEPANCDSAGLSTPSAAPPHAECADVMLPPVSGADDTLPPVSSGDNTLPPHSGADDTLPPVSGGADTLPPVSGGADMLPLDSGADVSVLEQCENSDQGTGVVMSDIPTIPPTMHSSLSANGIQVELANALDVMTAKTTKTISEQPCDEVDDFEKEIASMLAGSVDIDTDIFSSPTEDTTTDTTDATINVVKPIVE